MPKNSRIRIRIQDPEPNPDPDPLVRGMDPRIRIHPKMSWIRNTGGGEEERLAIGLEDVKEAARRSHVLYDRTGDQHYFMASALQKSIRGQGLLFNDEIYCTIPGPPLLLIGV